MVPTMAPHSMFPLAPTLGGTMLACRASVSPPAKWVEEEARNAVSPPFTPGLGCGWGTCRPKASAASKQSLTLHEARLMFAAGGSPESSGARCGGKGGFNDLPDLPHYQC